MKIKKTVITRQEDIIPNHVNHGEYEYYKRLVVPKVDNQCTVAFMEIPPKKCAFPNHYHESVTEVFYIISGQGMIKTADGETSVGVGDIAVFPPGKQGSHKIFNVSKIESLCYLDIDTTSMPDVCHYPDSKKVGIFSDDKMGMIYKEADHVDYYEGE